MTIRISTIKNRLISLEMMKGKCLTSEVDLTYLTLELTRLGILKLKPLQKK